VWNQSAHESKGLLEDKHNEFAGISSYQFKLYVSLVDLVKIAVWNHSIHSELASETHVAPMVFGLYVQ
jgi:hypothetical protein